MNSEVEKYTAVEKWCRKEISAGADFLFDPVLFHDALYRASNEFGFPFEALFSFFRNTHVLHVKKTTHRVKSSVDAVARDYTKGTSILDLAKRKNYPPYLFCRILVEGITNIRAGRKSLADAMKDPRTHLGDANVLLQQYASSETIEPPTDTMSSSSERTTRLAREVVEAIEADPMYGPRHDRERCDVGIEYERRLEECLKAIDVPFESEEALRERGTSRTPDVLLSCPMGVRVKPKDTKDDGWRVVCWIDSKALFGDVNTHHTSVIPQAESYAHRFGPGMILYWFGHAPLGMLDDAHGDVVVVGWEVPHPMLFPTGELTKRQCDQERSSGDVPSME